MERGSRSLKIVSTVLLYHGVTSELLLKKGESYEIGTCSYMDTSKPKRLLCTVPQGDNANGFESTGRTHIAFSVETPFVIQSTERRWNYDRGRSPHDW